MEIKIGDLLFATIFAGTVGAALASVNDHVPIPEIGQTYGYDLAAGVGLIMFCCYALGRFNRN